MATSQVAPLAWNVPIVDPRTGNPTPYFQELIQQWLVEKGVTDGLAAGALQDAASSGVLLGRASAGDGAVEELTLSQALDLIGSAAQGDLLFRGASGWQRLPAGASGQFLETQGAGADPAWGAVSGGGGSLVLLDTQIVSVTSSVIFNSTKITGTYSQYMLRWFGVIPSASTSMGMQLSPDNGTTWRTTGYNGTTTIWQINGTFSAKSSTGTTYLPLSYNIANDTTYPQSGEFVVSGLANASVKKLGYGSGVERASDGNRYQFNCGGEYNTAETINAVRVVLVAGTITGTFKLYGIA